MVQAGCRKFNNPAAPGSAASAVRDPGWTMVSMTNFFDGQLALGGHVW
jgi:hypothetical protein